MEHLSGGDILIRALRDANVKYIWGYPGGAALHIYDAIYRQEDVVHLLVRHEQAAVHAADGFSRTTGEVGTALVTSGPGATNAITGIATAYMHGKWFLYAVDNDARVVAFELPEIN